MSDKSDLSAELAFGKSEFTGQQTISGLSAFNIGNVTEMKADDDFYRSGVGGRAQIYNRFDLCRTSPVSKSEMESVAESLIIDTPTLTVLSQERVYFLFVLSELFFEQLDHLFGDVVAFPEFDIEHFGNPVEVTAYGGELSV